VNNFVLDTSVAINWYLPDESSALTRAVLEDLAEGATAIVPPLWFWEINNALTMNERKGRIDAVSAQQNRDDLQALPIEVDADCIKAAWSETTRLAQQHTLTIYDAAYLELAVRRRLPLASLDRALRKAAVKLKVKVLPAKL
jgi:predicted nucleic acid-binding protein